jgi:hypothetical protein
MYIGRAPSWRLELGLGATEAQQELAGLALDDLRRETEGLQPRDHPRLGQVIDLRTPHRRELDGRVVAEDVGQRVEDADEQHDGDQEVLPGRILVEHRSASE